MLLARHPTKRYLRRLVAEAVQIFLRDYFLQESEDCLLLVLYIFRALTASAIQELLP